METSLQQALQHARGERYDLRTTVLPAPSIEALWHRLTLRKLFILSADPCKLCKLYYCATGKKEEP